MRQSGKFEALNCLSSLLRSSHLFLLIFFFSFGSPIVRGWKVIYTEIDESFLWQTLPAVISPLSVFSTNSLHPV